MIKLIPKNGNDAVDTPLWLCRKIIEYFHPSGKLLEPFMGSGNFCKYMNGCDWCEISEGRAFFEYKDTDVDWIITNPPYSKVRKCLQHSYEIGVKNIVYVIPINHILGMKARLRDMTAYGYSVYEIILIDTPAEFPQSGFQFAVIHIGNSLRDHIRITDWRGQNHVKTKINTGGGNYYYE